MKERKKWDVFRDSKMLDDTVAKLAVIDERNAFSRVYPPTTSDKCRSIGT